VLFDDGGERRSAVVYAHTANEARYAVGGAYERTRATRVEL